MSSALLMMSAAGKSYFKVKRFASSLYRQPFQAATFPGNLYNKGYG